MESAHATMDLEEFDGFLGALVAGPNVSAAERHTRTSEDRPQRSVPLRFGEEVQALLPVLASRFVRKSWPRVVDTFIARRTA
jgi:hypothetical protein